MTNFFRKSTAYVDQEFADLSHMLFKDLENKTYKRELLDGTRLDFSVESLKHLDSYLEALHSSPPQQNDLVGVVLRCGAYVGEVIRKHASTTMHWVAFEEAARHSEFASGLGYSLATAAILWTNSKTMYFPLAKVCKFLENGNEDSLYFFAQVILQKQ